MPAVHDDALYASLVNLWYNMVMKRNNRFYRKNIFTALPRLVLAAAVLWAAVLGALPLTAGEPAASDGVPPILREMSPGWNLGNTFDALGKGLESERAWGQPKTTREMIAGLAAGGIRTVRIPVSWAMHMDKKGKIDSKWMARVKEVVDWCLDEGLFVIVNCHHDNAESESMAKGYTGYYPSAKKKSVSIKFITAVWSEVAASFKDYDEHLIFETLNEPRLRGTNAEWWPPADMGGNAKVREAQEVVNEMNQASVDTIRKAGGKNSTRYIMVPALRAGIYDAQGKSFVLPNDDAHRILVSVHSYVPNDFAMASPGDSKFTEAHERDIASLYAALEERFTSHGIGVVVGEYGATNKDNLEDRVKWFKFITHEAAKRDMPMCLWDNGDYKTASGPNGYSEKFGFYDRKNQSWYFPEILEVLTGK